MSGGHPRPAIYAANGFLTVNGVLLNGWPLFDAAGNLITAVANAYANWDLVCLTEEVQMRADLLAYLRARNPNIKIIAFLRWGQTGYFNPAHTLDPVTDIRAYIKASLEALGNGSNGRLKCYCWSNVNAGQYFNPETPNAGVGVVSNFQRNVVHADVVNAYAALIAQYVIGRGFDGVFFDYGRLSVDTASNPDHNGPNANPDGIDYANDGYTTDPAGVTAWAAAFLAGVQSLAAQVRAAAPPGFIINFNNGGVYDTTADQSVNLNGRINGGMVEDWPNQGGSSGGDSLSTKWQKNMLGTGAFAGVLNADALIQAPHENWMTGTASGGNSWTVAANLQLGRYLAASAALCDALAVVSFGPQGGGDNPWDKRFPEYGVDVATGVSLSGLAAYNGWLGDALGPYVVGTGTETGTYRRVYPRGLVYVNPTAATVTVTPGLTPGGVPYRRIISGIPGDPVNVGGAVASYAIPAHDAIFLVGDAPVPVSAPAAAAIGTTLLATLHPTRVLVSSTVPVGGAATVNDPGTPAGLADGSDATWAEFDTTGDGGSQAGAGAGRTEWALEPASLDAGAVISSIVVRIRNQSLGGPAGQSVSIAGVTRDPVSISNGTILDRSVQFPVDPADGQPWTAAKLAAQGFGWFCVAASYDPFTTAAIRTYELSVEVWGTGATPQGLHTDYQVLGPPNTSYQVTAI